MQTIPPHILSDATLSLQAKGLLSIILLRAGQGGQFNHEEVLPLTGGGSTQFKAAMRQLKAAGLVKRVTLRERGRITGTVMRVNL